ncbi:DNA phosphorothioation-dependent restriction protein DptF [uncultured Intestinimonas sp.]|uniref:DNA phosphorothioation-dependent restriction protein DptF n=2 Tax=Bacillota TaxID=1239 RepID=UPI00294363D2|nr:DNA phosphorothioation-dependent restriction protein DptF [uncultured Intestinimonas sp.]
MACSFIAELSKLRKLSVESVENTNSFDDFKRYMHVLRPVETELRKLLVDVNDSNHKTLVLLCGSAGDGKSHLLSYLRNADQEHLLASYEVYNDATESSAPQLTSIDTLSEKLAPFNDQNYTTDDGFKMILAINLGTLNNFIESEKGKNFSALKKYVEDKEIFSSFVRDDSYQTGSVFQHISFSDYQIFTLSENGVETDYLEELIGKIFQDQEANPFFKAFNENSNCSLCQKCPVRHNYQFLSNPIHQKALIKKIIEVVIKDKEIVSTRDILNLLYDILVHPDFDYAKMCQVATNDTQYLSEYIRYTTPMLLYEYDDISPLVNSIRRHDILKIRQADLDVDMTRFHALENIHDIFSSATDGTPYAVLNDTTNIADLGGIKADLKKLVYRFIIRIKDLKGELPPTKQEKLFDEYIQYLFYQNSGQEKKLSKLYEATKKAIMNWDGQFDSDTICIDDSNEKFWVLEQLLLKPSIYSNRPSADSVVQRFSPTVKLRFRKDSDSNLETAEISMDYSLFEMISAMKEGYRPTVQDKNQHTDFVSFIQRVIEFGNKAARIVLIPKEQEHDYRVVFEKTDFGYEFKVV